MSVTKLAVVVAVAALLSGSQLSRLSSTQRHDLVATLQGWSIDAPPGPGKPAVASMAGNLPIAPGAPPSAARTDRLSFGPDETIAPDTGGQFYTFVDIDGQRLGAMVDTGATFLTLSAEDADRIGIRPAPSDFTIPVNTANGRVLVAKVRLATVRLGSITVRDVAALVAGRHQMSGSLLGMSFLSRLSAFRVDRGKLVLEQ